ncbi:14762_t:CDS:2, partial [Racocetra persica]
TVNAKSNKVKKTNKHKKRKIETPSETPSELDLRERVLDLKEREISLREREVKIRELEIKRSKK